MGTDRSSGSAGEVGIPGCRTTVEHRRLACLSSQAKWADESGSGESLPENDGPLAAAAGREGVNETGAGGGGASPEDG